MGTDRSDPPRPGTPLADTGAVVRIATWNCRSALDKKMAVVEAIDADVLIVQECTPATVLGRQEGITSLWSAPYPSATKGVGVFCRAPWTAHPAGTDPTLPWVLPAAVSNTATGGQFTLLAMWANKKQGPSYASQFTAVLDTYAAQLRAGQCVIAGDLNASVQGPSREAHRHNLFRAKELDMVSAYHHANSYEHGGEQDMTLRWVAPGGTARYYHCDFIFLPRRMAEGAKCSVLTLFDAERPASDHQPVIADISLV